MSYAEIKHTLNSKVGTSEFKALNELIGGDITALQSLLTSGHVPIVKSVQRGTFESEGSITIKSVDITKSILITSGDGGGAYAYAIAIGTYSTRYGGGRAVLLAHLSNSTTITVNNTRNAIGNGEGSSTLPYGKLSWQVIEFY